MEKALSASRRPGTKSTLAMATLLMAPPVSQKTHRETRDGCYFTVRRIESVRANIDKTELSRMGQSTAMLRSP